MFLEMLIEFLIGFLMYVAITVVWQITEKLIYGKTSPRLIDDVVAVILSISLYHNFF